MHDPFAFENADDFFVQVKVIRRAAGWDRADELRDLGLHQLGVPAIARLLPRLIGEADHFRLSPGRRRRCEGADVGRPAVERRAIHDHVRVAGIVVSSAVLVDSSAEEVVVC